jgi:hypothetical protein
MHGNFTHPPTRLEEFQGTSGKADYVLGSGQIAILYASASGPPLPCATPGGHDLVLENSRQRPTRQNEKPQVYPTLFFEALP